jgi:hypothetical protein
MKKCITNKEMRRFSIFNLQSLICLLVFSMLSLNLMAQDVYVGGTFNGKAAVWKNGVPTILSTGDGYVFSVVVNKGSVYAAGYEHETVTSCTHKVWKDGVELYAVSASGSYGWSHSVAVSDNGDVYMAARDGGSYKVWRNGNLESGDLGQWGSVFTSGDDVYMVGTYNNDVHVMKNGELIIVIDDDTYNLAQKVFVVDDIIYTAVYGSTDGDIWKPKVYKYDTLLYAFESTGTGYGLAYDCELGLFVSGDDVYVAGHEKNQTTYGLTAKLWINDSAIDLADGEDMNCAYSVFQYDNDVYVAGNVQGIGSGGTLWINGTPTTIDGGARSVFVAPADTLLTITLLGDPAHCGVVTGSGTYPYGYMVTVEAISSPCCTFLYWEEDGVIFSTDSIYMFSVTRDRTLVARFEAGTLGTHEITVSANPPEGGYVYINGVLVPVGGGGGTYLCGTEITVEAVPSEGFEFVYWGEDGAIISYDHVFMFIVTGDWILVANFELLSPMPPIIITESLPDGTIGAPYSATLEADSNTPVTWGLESGSLPDGLSLNAATGEISGTSTEIETSDFTIKASNADGSDIKLLTIIIHLAPAILINSLPDGATGTPYSATLEAESDTPITWSIGRSGGLPTGLFLDAATGVIDGLPSEVGVFDFTILATNTAGGSVSKDLSIVVELGMGIEELQVTSYELRVFPNPTDGVLQVTSDELQVTSIEIFDLMGKRHECTNARMHEGTIIINVESLPAGVYFVKINNKISKFVKK